MPSGDWILVKGEHSIVNRSAHVVSAAGFSDHNLLLLDLKVSAKRKSGVYSELHGRGHGHGPTKHVPIPARTYGAFAFVEREAQPEAGIGGGQRRQQRRGGGGGRGEGRGRISLRQG